MPGYKDLRDTELENWFKQFFENELKFTNYYPRSGQISLNQLDSTQHAGQHLEIDGVFLFNKTAVLVEFTGEQDNLRDKIKKFTRNCNLFVGSNKSLGEKFSLFTSIPQNKLRDFEEVTQWRFVFFGTSSEIDIKGYMPAQFPDYPPIQNNLIILGQNSIEYFYQLSDLIHEYSKYEFLSTIKITPVDLGIADSDVRKPFIRVENCFVSENCETRSEVFLIKFKPEELLKMGRVSRYEGIPFTVGVNEEEKGRYQRFLIKNKLKSIAQEFIQNEKRRTFPNTVTLVLPSNCHVTGNELVIPNSFSTIDIIDGQHRIFAYADSTVSNEVRTEGSILASAIKFQTQDPTQISRFAAKVFCEINSKQAKVKNNLIYLIKYDVLGDKDTVAIAGKVLLDCNRGTSALSNIFLINTLQKKNKLNLTPIPIVTIVDSDLEQFVSGKGVKDIPLPDDEFARVFGHTKEHLRTHTDDWCQSVKAILEKYFNRIKTNFPADWKRDSTSVILSAKYIAAFVRLIRYQLINQRMTVDEAVSTLDTLKTNVEAKTRPTPTTPAFPPNHRSIPTTKSSVPKIYTFLKKNTTLPRTRR